MRQRTRLGVSWRPSAVLQRSPTRSLVSSRRPASGAVSPHPTPHPHPSPLSPHPSPSPSRRCRGAHSASADLRARALRERSVELRCGRRGHRRGGGGGAGGKWARGRQGQCGRRVQWRLVDQTGRRASTTHTRHLGNLPPDRRDGIWGGRRWHLGVRCLPAAASRDAHPSNRWVCMCMRACTSI